MKRNKPTLTITITPADAISAGPYISSFGCLLATATRRQLGPDSIINCGGTFVYIGSISFRLSGKDSDRILRCYRRCLISRPVVEKSFDVKLRPA